MAVFKLTLQHTYFKQGFFNVVIDYDRYVRPSDGAIRLRLGKDGVEVGAQVSRQVNRNGTARILGGVPLRNWFQQNFEPLDIVAVDLTDKELIVLDRG